MMIWLMWLAAAYAFAALICGLWLYATSRNMDSPDAARFAIKWALAWPLVLTARVWIWRRSRSGEPFWWVRRGP